MLVDQIEEVENSSKEVGGGEGEAEGKQVEEGEGRAVAEVAVVPRVPGQLAGAGEEGGEVSRAIQGQDAEAPHVRGESGADESCSAGYSWRSKVEASQRSRGEPVRAEQGGGRGTSSMAPTRPWPADWWRRCPSVSATAAPR